MYNRTLYILVEYEKYFSFTVALDGVLYHCPRRLWLNPLL